MNVRLRLSLLISLLVLLAPVCISAGGDTKVRTFSVRIAPGALVEVRADVGEVIFRKGSSNTLEITATLANADRIRYFVQTLTPEPVAHVIINATAAPNSEHEINSVIEIAGPDGLVFDVQTSGRAITVDGVSPANAELTTSSGDIRVQDARGDYRLSTTNGDLSLIGVNGTFWAETTNGAITLRGTLTSDSPNRLETTNGVMDIRLGPDSDVRITAEAGGGELTSDVPGGVRSATGILSASVGPGAGTLAIVNKRGAINLGMANSSASVRN